MSCFQGVTKVFDENREGVGGFVGDSTAGLDDGVGLVSHDMSLVVCGVLACCYLFYRVLG